MSDEEFMERYKKLVYHCVWKRYGSKIKGIERDTGLGIEDLKQQGMVGLIKAKRRFDVSHGCQFSTYGVPMIIGEVSRYIRDRQKVKITRDIYALKGKISREKLAEKAPEEIVNVLGEPIHLVETALKYQPSTISFQTVVYDSNQNGDATLEQVIADKETESVEEEVINRAILDTFISTLVHKESIVLDKHLQNKTQQRIANEIGISQVQVSRILKRIQQRATEFGKEQGLAK
ncbi:sigma-70 family RNA polymerase sigma factor [Bacillus sp. FDAARGOS_1420]|nr:sigma-70 family RNA polymerase sigma factor [Bacillus sp. FDAARGOS_1420]